MLVAYTITPNDRDPKAKGFWTRIGVAFKNRDGSFNIKLNALPVNGEIHIREQEPQPAGGGGYRSPSRREPAPYQPAGDPPDDFPDAF